MLACRSICNTRTGSSSIETIDGSGKGRVSDPLRAVRRGSNGSSSAYLRERDSDPVTAVRLYAEAAPSAPNLSERNHLRRQAHGSTRSCAVERRAAGIHRPDRDGLLTLLAGRAASLGRHEPEDPVLLAPPGDHRKPNPPE
jgi:hypothetical protein